MHFQACSLYVIGCGSEFLHVVIKQGALDHMKRASFDVNYRFSHVLVDVAKISLCEKCVTGNRTFSQVIGFFHIKKCAHKTCPISHVKYLHLYQATGFSSRGTNKT